MDRPSRPGVDRWPDLFAADRRRQMARPLRRGSPPTGGQTFWRGMTSDGQTFWRLAFCVSFLRMRGAREWPRPSAPVISREPTGGQTFWRGMTSDGQTFWRLAFHISFLRMRGAREWPGPSAPVISREVWPIVAHSQMDRPSRPGVDRWPDLFAGDRRRQMATPRQIDRPFGEAVGESRRRRVVLRLRKPGMSRQMDRRQMDRPSRPPRQMATRRQMDRPLRGGGDRRRQVDRPSGGWPFASHS